MTLDNSIFIGPKAFMNYVTGVVMQFTTEDANEVIVKARGKFITRAVDVSQMAVKQFLEDQIEVKNISIDSDKVTNKDGKEVQVSSIEITLGRIE